MPEYSHCFLKRGNIRDLHFIELSGISDVLGVWHLILIPEVLLKSVP